MLGINIPYRLLGMFGRSYSYHWCPFHASLKKNFILILCDFLGRFQSSALISRDEKSAIKRGTITMLGIHVSVKTCEMFHCTGAIVLRYIVICLCFTGIFGEFYRFEFTVVQHRQCVLSVFQTLKEAS